MISSNKFANFSAAFFLSNRLISSLRTGFVSNFWPFSHRSPHRDLEPSAAGRTSEIQAPTLILTAEHDIPACLEIADLLDESVPDSRKVTMEESGHLLHMEKPEEFNQHLVDFIKTVR